MSEIFPVKDIQKPLGEVVASAGLRQLRIAETEKYPHVTFFFNGGVESVYEVRPPSQIFPSHRQ
jgi:2,3-bisphosphoglycerate-independent phosphoglycerate mutase